jgi:hypothetical protein
MAEVIAKYWRLSWLYLCTKVSTAPSPGFSRSKEQLSGKLLSLL